MLVREDFHDWPSNSKMSCVAISNTTAYITDIALSSTDAPSRGGTRIGTDCSHVRSHPTRVFRPSAPRLIEPLEQRLSRLDALGFKPVLVQRPDRDFAALSAEAFIKYVLIEGLRAKHVAVGLDFKFGKGRSGDTETLRTAMDGTGGGAEIMPELRDQEGTVVSSTVIQQAIQSGDMTRAGKLLDVHPNDR